MILDYCFAHVAGARRHNADGTARQAIIRRCRVGELLTLEQDHDIDVVRVLRQCGDQLGYLEPVFAEEIVARTAKGEKVRAAIAGVARPHWSAPLAATLLVIGYDGDASEAQLEQRAREILRRDRLIVATVTPRFHRRRRPAAARFLVGTLIGLAVTAIAVAVAFV
jgi:hypothetical protein